MRVFILCLFGLPLMACSTMNSNFSCDQTAIDHCFTIEEIDAMTQYADDHDAK